MFVRVVLGPVTDAVAVRSQWDRWHAEVGPATSGWLRSTGGVTADGRVVAATFFDSPGPEGWLEAASGLLAGPPAAASTVDVSELVVGDPSTAGFVQAMRAPVKDRARFEALEEEIGPLFVAARPDVLAGYRVWLGAGEVVALDYFTSEAEARAGESRPVPDALAAGFQDWQAQLADPEWFDLPAPWIAAPR